MQFNATWVAPLMRPPVFDRPANLRRVAHDSQSADDPRGKGSYMSRSTGETYWLPETEKLVDPAFVRMTAPLARLWYGLFAFYAPRHYKTSPPLGSYDEYYDFGFRPANLLDERWLGITHTNLAWTNKQGWSRMNSEPIGTPSEHYDPITTANYATGRKEFFKEGVVPCGNVVWATGRLGAAGSVEVWCIDALATQPSWEQVVSMPFLVHAATEVGPMIVAPPDADAPKGNAEVGPFPQLRGDNGANMVPIPLWSARVDGAQTMVYKGVPLRTNWIESIRILPLADSAPIPNPYVPARPLVQSE